MNISISKGEEVIYREDENQFLKMANILSYRFSCFWMYDDKFLEAQIWIFLEFISPFEVGLFRLN